MDLDSSSNLRLTASRIISVYGSLCFHLSPGAKFELRVQTGDPQYMKLLRICSRTPEVCTPTAQSPLTLGLDVRSRKILATGALEAVLSPDAGDRTERAKQLQPMVARHMVHPAEAGAGPGAGSPEA